MDEQVTPRRFRKKPVEIEAMQTGVDHDLDCAVLRWCGGRAVGDGDTAIFVIDTLEGALEVKRGDWVICGVQGEFYPCKPDIFEATYEAVEGMGLSGVLEGSRLGKAGEGS